MAWFKDRVSRRSNLLYAYEGSPAQIPDLPEGFVFTELDTELVSEYFASPEDASRRGRYMRFLEQGQRGFMVSVGNQWAAVGWIVPAEVWGMPAHIPASVANHPWLSEAHTRPEYRGRGLHKFLLAKRLALLAQENPTAAVTAMSDVNPRNTASRRSHISSGFKPVGWVHAWTVRLPRLPAGPYGFVSRYQKHPDLDQ